jgi:hypothetical protein
MGRDLPQDALDAGVSAVRATRGVIEGAVKRVRGGDHGDAIPSSEATHEHSAREEGCPPVILTAAQTEQFNEIAATPAPSNKQAAAKRKSPAKARRAARA